MPPLYAAALLGGKPLPLRGNARVVKPSRGVTRRPVCDERGRGAVVAVPGVVLQLVLARPPPQHEELLLEVHRGGVRPSAGVDLAAEPPQRLRHVCCGVDLLSLGIIVSRSQQQQQQHERIRSGSGGWGEAGRGGGTDYDVFDTMVFEGYCCGRDGRYCDPNPVPAPNLIDQSMYGLSNIPHLHYI